MNAFDGNAVAGALFDVFGTEMTDARGTCASCQAVSLFGELTVFLGGPGTVVRCRDCDNILLVLVEARGVTCVDALGLAAVEHPARHQQRPSKE